MAKHSIYLAVGHGKSYDGTFDCGCTYGDDTEAALMLNIAKHAVSLLRKSGIDVLTDADGGNNKNLKATVSDANAYGVDAYISLHCDYSKAPSGTLPIVYPGSASGMKLAKCVDSAYRKATGLPLRYIQETDHYEVAYTNMPACIFETGSISADNKKLKDYKTCGKGIAQGICDYFGVKLKSSATTKEEAKKPATPKKETEKIEVDGLWGKDTTRATQIVLKCAVVDGIISGQLKSCMPYLRHCIATSWEFNNGDGSPTIKALQKLVGAKVDGYAGEETVKCLQTFLNKHGFNCGKVDGFCEEKTVSAWQKFINSKL